MTTFLPQNIQQDLIAAHRDRLAKKSRLRLNVDGDWIAVHKFWDEGFTVDAADAPHLRGLVDLYDGSRMIYQCLIIASTEENGQMTYEFKRHTPALDHAPLDFFRASDAPIALLPRDF